ncbi:hypothetical protein SKAU_G00254790 [Synaphobranchus kaupii]|uniref:Uncharacterized protein n=1 Tax=Synaphobranchus kaupii TaxID=118154 RepID=A0A9Q1F3N3_SYNKA|nr:hypothetical protein SKAU_G00254790 [Synaphobranchus kaupii]
MEQRLGPGASILSTACLACRLLRGAAGEKRRQLILPIRRPTVRSTCSSLSRITSSVCGLSIILMGKEERRDDAAAAAAAAAATAVTRRNRHRLHTALQSEGFLPTDRDEQEEEEEEEEVGLLTHVQSTR